MRTRVVPLLALLASTVMSAACREKAPEASNTVVAGPAPDSFRVVFETSRGPFIVQVYRPWAPKGADRFYALVQQGFFDDSRFFRVVPGFVVQFGLAADPKLNEPWDKRIADDSVSQSNLRGTLTFATQGPNTRSHQLFINLADNPRLDAMGFAPIGRVIEGMNVVDSLYSGYGEEPDQEAIRTQGNSYADRMFPKLDRIKTARVSARP
jgi:peptidyl-prolyl cis-trans isomerase A (cyclophilin A)